MDEKRLVRRLKRREERAFNQLVLRYQRPIYAVCFRMLGNAAEAEDVAQDVFVKCFQAIHSFRGESQLGTWLYRIAVNLCRNRLKYLGRRQYNGTARFEDLPEGAVNGTAAPGRVVAEPAPRPDAAFEGKRAEAAVQAALAAIDAEFRELLVLRDIEGLSYHEIQRITGLAEGTVKSRLHRARAALAKAYRIREGGA